MPLKKKDNLSQNLDVLLFCPPKVQNQRFQLFLEFDALFQSSMPLATHQKNLAITLAALAPLAAGVRPQMGPNF